MDQNQKVSGFEWIVGIYRRFWAAIVYSRGAFTTAIGYSRRALASRDTIKKLELFGLKYTLKGEIQEIRAKLV